MAWEIVALGKRRPKVGLAVFQWFDDVTDMFDYRRFCVGDVSGVTAADAEYPCGYGAAKQRLALRQEQIAWETASSKARKAAAIAAKKQAAADRAAARKAATEERVANPPTPKPAKPDKFAIFQAEHMGALAAMRSEIAELKASIAIPARDPVQPDRKPRRAKQAQQPAA